MRWVACVLLLALIGGCAETPEIVQDVETDAAGSAGNPALAGHLVAGLANATIQAGVPFNVTLEFRPDEASGASPGNSTEGNSTQDNSTQDNSTQGNGTMANGTAPAPSQAGAAEAAQMAWTVTFANATGNTSYNGTGLPAAFQANLTHLGNVTMSAAATWGNTTFVMEPLALVVEAAAAALDPCVGVPAQEGISRSGILGPGAANSGLVTNNNFEVGACQIGMTVQVTTTTGASDIIIRLVTPDGTVDHDANFVGGETLVYVPEGGLVPGAYNAQVRPYAVVADQYQLTITFHEA